MEGTAAVRADEKKQRGAGIVPWSAGNRFLTERIVILSLQSRAYNRIIVLRLQPGRFLHGQERMALFMERGRPTLAGGLSLFFYLLSQPIIAQPAALCNEKSVR